MLACLSSGCPASPGSGTGVRPSTRRPKVRTQANRVVALFSLSLLLTFPCEGLPQTRVQDIFGRTLNEHGITLVDWDGYLANPLIKFYVFPPTNGVLPGSATLTANGGRLYFDTPSSVSPTGPGKTVSFTNAGVGVPVRLSIFPDRDSLDEDYTLTLVFAGANNGKQTNTVPIHVVDQDVQRANNFAVTVNFDRDITGFSRTRRGGRWSSRRRMIGPTFSRA